MISGCDAAGNTVSASRNRESTLQGTDALYPGRCQAVAFFHWYHQEMIGAFDGTERGRISTLSTADFADDNQLFPLLAIASRNRYLLLHGTHFVGVPSQLFSKLA